MSHNAPHVACDGCGIAHDDIKELATIQRRNELWLELFRNAARLRKAMRSNAWLRPIFRKYKRTCREILLQKQNEAARQLLTASLPSAYQALAQDRLGDLAMLEGKKSDAIGFYQTAWKAMDERAEYRRLLEIKLAALGVAPKAPEKEKP